jgi:hypothetical protein
METSTASSWSRGRASPTMSDVAGAPTAPLPPADLASRALRTVPIAAGETLWRLHRRDRNPVFFGPPDGDPPAARFDAPDGAFKVLYAARSPEGAFAETALRQHGRLVAWTWLSARALCPLRVVRRLQLAQLHGAGLARMRATAAVTSGAYAVSRWWAAAIHAHPNRVDGLLYRARHDNDAYALALFDRARRKVEPPRGPTPPLALDPRLPALLHRYGIGIIDDGALGT